MQYFKHWIIIFLAIIFWMLFFIFIHIINKAFYNSQNSKIIVYDLTEGALENQLHLEPEKILSPQKKGEEIFKQCAICHSLQPNEIRIGPSLYNIIDKKIASNKNFLYSQALSNFATQKKIWNPKLLDNYIENPAKIVPGNRMAFVGINSAEDRKNLLTYLKKVKK